MKLRSFLLLIVSIIALALLMRPVFAMHDKIETDDDTDLETPVVARDVTPLINGEKFDFQAKTAKLLDILINTLYKNKDTPIRELISNASDALNKLRIAILKGQAKSATLDDLKIQIVADNDAKTLTIRDFGVGMSKDDLVNNLGTLAKSGTAEFLEKQIAESASNSSKGELIGQFGVGFYSAYLIASKVTVRTRNFESPSAYVWESMADNSFVIAEDPNFVQSVGTEIVLHLKADADEFLNQSKLQDLIKRYSVFIDFPIYLEVEKSEEIEVAKEDKDDEKPKNDSDDDDHDDVEDVDETKEKTSPQKETRKYREFELMNPHKPIWRRDPKEVEAADYADFYKALIADWKEETHHKEPPLGWRHFRSEGQISFSAIIYIPGEAKPNQLNSAQDQLPKNVKLFVKKVFITDEIEDFLPRHLSFVKVVIDSDDLPLNVNREQLQHTKLLRSIKKKILSKTYELLREISDDTEKWPKFGKAFGTNLKLGVLEDSANKEKLLKMIRFHSSSANNETTPTVTLDDYLSRMKKKQSGIFYLSGASLAEIKQSVFLEKPLARGYEVLYMPDPIDEYLMQSVTEFGGKQFKSIAKDGLKYGDESKESKAAQKEERKKFAPLTKWMAKVLEKDVEKVVLSPRLTTSPAAIVAKQWGWSGNMERIMNSQALGGQEDFMRDFYSKQKKVLEINPQHPLIVGLLSKVEKSSSETLEKDTDAEESVRVLYDTTLVTSGYQIGDVPSFARRIELVIRRALKVDENAKAQVKVTPAAEKIAGEPEEEEDDKKNDDADNDDDDDDSEDNNDGDDVIENKKKKGKFEMPEMPEMPDMLEDDNDDEKIGSKDESGASADDSHDEL